MKNETSRKDELICIICPLGCVMSVDHDEREVLAVDGNRCRRGLEYAQKEIFDPERIATTTVRILGASVPLLPVRTERGIPRDKTTDVIREASRIRVEAPVRMGEVIVRNILGTGVNLIATRSLESGGS